MSSFYLARQLAYTGQTRTDAWWKSLEGYYQVWPFYTALVKEIAAKKPVLIRRVNPDVEFGPNFPNQPDYRRRMVRQWNRWVDYLTDIYRSDNMKFQPNKMKHIYVYGDSGCGKTYTARNILLGNLTDEQIFRINTHSKNTMYEQFNPDLHQVCF